MDMPCIKVKKNARVDGKKETSLEIYQLYLRKMIYKNGKRTALLAMGKDGLLLKQYSHL
jgi:hypothetical protein